MHAHICRHVAAMTICAAAALLIGACDTPVVDVSGKRVPVISETAGTGREARPRSVVTIHYRATMEDGTEVLNDRDYVFEVGAGAVISGIDEAVEGMRVGGTRVVRCLPHKHWGRKGYGNIPPNTTLVFHIELVSVQ